MQTLQAPFSFSPLPLPPFFLPFPPLFFPFTALFHLPSLLSLAPRFSLPFVFRHFSPPHHSSESLRRGINPIESTALFSFLSFRVFEPIFFLFCFLSPPRPLSALSLPFSSRMFHPLPLESINPRNLHAVGALNER